VHASPPDLDQASQAERFGKLMNGNSDAHCRPCPRPDRRAICPKARRSQSRRSYVDTPFLAGAQCSLGGARFVNRVPNSVTMSTPAVRDRDPEYLHCNFRWPIGGDPDPFRFSERVARSSSHRLHCSDSSSARLRFTERALTSQVAPLIEVQAPVDIGLLCHWPEK
jgi:hypothetical protein